MEYEKQNEMDRLHRALLLIALEIKRICEKNEIPFFLIGGTLLGAVRHKGFIPWDDDMDIGMCRDDYDRFIDACKRDLDSRFFLSTYNTEKLYAKPFAKIRLIGTHFPEPDAPMGICDGIFVDVFPIDRIPPQKFKRTIHNLRNKFYLYVLLVKSGYCVDNSKFMFLAKLFARRKKEDIISAILRCQTKYNKYAQFEYANLCGTYKYGKDVLPIECVDNPVLIEFEKMLFPAPKNPGRVLSIVYGDYMELPPESQRVSQHTSSDIDFGDVN